MSEFALERSPFQLFLLIAVTISGVWGLLPHVLDALSLTWPWYVGLVLGGMGGTVAMFLRYPMNLLVERVALYLLAGLMLAYSVAVFILLGRDAFYEGGLVILAFGVACMWRVGQIEFSISRAKRP